MKKNPRLEFIVVQSVNRPELLSVRITHGEETATAFRRALKGAGFVVGDEVVMKLRKPRESN